MSTLNNPPAFPVTFEHDEATSEYFGMTLRDYFAAKAMQGILSNPDHSLAFGTIYNDPEKDQTTDLVLSCYHIADAMLATRAKPTEAP